MERFTIALNPVSFWYDIKIDWYISKRLIQRSDDNKSRFEISSFLHQGLVAQSGFLIMIPGRSMDSAAERFRADPPIR